MGNKYKPKSKLAVCRKKAGKRMWNILRERRDLLMADKNGEANQSSRPVLAELQNVFVASPSLADTQKNKTSLCKNDTLVSAEIQKVCEETRKDEMLICEKYSSKYTEDRSKAQPHSSNYEIESDTELEIETCVSSTAEVLHIDGRRIVCLNFFLQNLATISSHNSAFGCTFSNLILISEKRKGLESKLKFTCNMCNMNFFLETNDPNDQLNLNKAAITGIMSTGIGFTQFEELCGSMDLPTLAQKHFDRLHNDVCDEWHKTAIDVMLAAGEREKEAAIARGHVTKYGIPYIDVIADGCWSKRSYKTNYSALSGAAAIVGRTFGEVLFIGVKNKYCCICSRAETKNEIPREHACFKNYSGSSTGMESDILLEGFKQSIVTHNLIYARMVADGDSSTFKKISEARVYPNFSVEKIECRNHIFRNMCSKLKAVSTDTKFPIQLRKKITTARILAVRKVICCAIKKNNSDDCDLSAKISTLYTDITNSLLHAFGDHSVCKDYYCQSTRMSEDLTLLLKTSAVWYRLKTIVTAVAAKSRSLICDVDSNRVQCFNSIVAKFVGGKRINFSLKRGYQARCDAAVVAFNSKKPLYTLHKRILGKSPSCRMKRLETRRANRVIKKRKIKKLLFQSIHDKNYGESCERPDMPDDVFSKCKEQFIKDLHKTNEEILIIERSTVLQRDSSEWLELRRNLITASNFARVVKRKQNTSPKNLVKQILYKRDISHVASVKHGIVNEKIALEQLEQQIRQKIKPCGLFIDPEIPFLGATPDGLIGDDTIVEIKCPISVYRTSLDEAIATGKVNFWKKPTDRNAAPIVNKNHPWYIQIQGQMHVTRRMKCIFAVWSGVEQDLKIETIYRDDSFWETKMKDKLETFYKNHLLAELCDPRHTRNMPIRD